MMRRSEYSLRLLVKEPARLRKERAGARCSSHSALTAGRPKPRPHGAANLHRREVWAEEAAGGRPTALLGIPSSAPPAGSNHGVRWGAAPSIPPRGCGQQGEARKVRAQPVPALLLHKRRKAEGNLTSGTPNPEQQSEDNCPRPLPSSAGPGQLGAQLSPDVHPLPPPTSLRAVQAVLPRREGSGDAAQPWWCRVPTRSPTAAGSHQRPQPRITQIRPASHPR